MSHESLLHLRKRLFLRRKRASQAENRARPRADGQVSGRVEVKRDIFFKFTVNLKRRTTSGGALHRAEEEASSRMSINTYPFR